MFIENRNVHNSVKMEIIQISVNGRMDKMWYICKMDDNITVEKNCIRQ